MDFVSHTLNGGRKFRSLNIADDFNRECLAAEVDASITGARAGAIAGSTRVAADSVTDNEREFAGRALDVWACEQGMKRHFIEPGKPVQNAFIESFNGKKRGECLNDRWFLSLEEARETIEAWRRITTRFGPILHWGIRPRKSS